MKMFIKSLFVILVIIFCLILYIDCNNDKYLSNELEIIKDKYKLNSFNYINKYMDYYIVKDKFNIYVLDLEYNEILKISLEKVHDNINNYDIVFRDNIVMYMSVTGNNKKVSINYYDIYTYEQIKEVLVEE